MANPTQDDIDAVIEKIDELGEGAFLYEIEATPLILAALKAYKPEPMAEDKRRALDDMKEHIYNGKDHGEYAKAYWLDDHWDTVIASLSTNDKPELHDHSEVIRDLAGAIDNYLVRNVSGLAVGAARERMAKALTKHAETIKNVGDE